MQLAPPFFCWAFPQPQHVWRKHVLPYVHPVSDLQQRHTRRMPKSTGRIFTMIVTARNFAPFVWRASFLACVWGFFSPFVSLGPRVWCRRRRSSFFCLWPLHKSSCASSSWLKLHESPLDRCPIAFHWLQSPTFLSTQAFLILFPQLRPGL